MLSESYFKHLHRDGSTCILDFDRLKGKKSGTNRLAPKTTAALYAYLEAIYPGQLLTLVGDAPVWVSFSDRNKGQALGTRSISNICEVYLGTSKTHAPRHTLAVTMHHKGAKITEISKALGHSNVSITSDYLEEHLILFHEVKDMIALVFLARWNVVQRNNISFSS